MWLVVSKLDSRFNFDGLVLLWMSPGAGWPPIRGSQNFWPSSYLILQQIVTTVMVILHPVSTNVTLFFGFPVNLNGGLSCSVFFNFFSGNGHLQHWTGHDNWPW
ncbi:hypothetical protein Peur_009748 [Populus x canadensis]